MNQELYIMIVPQNNETLRISRSVQRVERAVNLEKNITIHAEQTSGNGAEFRFLASGSCTSVLPPSKKRKTPMPQKLRISAAFIDDGVSIGYQYEHTVFILGFSQKSHSNDFRRDSDHFIDSLNAPDKERFIIFAVPICP